MTVVAVLEFPVNERIIVKKPSSTPNMPLKLPFIKMIAFILFDQLQVSDQILQNMNFVINVFKQVLLIIFFIL